MKLFYRQPADSWKECIPVGNGKLGGMIFGEPGREKICLNEDSLWSGYPGKKQTGNARGTEPEYLDKVREAVKQEAYAEAEEMLEEHLLGEFTESYLPMGTLYVDIPALVNAGGEPHGDDSPMQYERGLDLETGIAWVQTKWGEQEVRREYFCSFPDQCLVMHLESEQVLDRIDIRLESELKKTGTERKDSCRVEYRLQCPEHVDPNYVDSREPVIWGDRGKRFSVCISIAATDGNVCDDCGYLSVFGAKSITVVLTAVNNPAIIEPYEVLRKRHQDDYKNLYGRTELYLGDQPDVPTDVRLRNLREGHRDNALYALYFQYGRYLMISSSRGKSSLPATLQGIWCWEMQPPWSSNWTTNINTQMNYWPVHKCNLSECVKPYVEWMKQLARTGEETAEKYFGCRGYSVNHNVDGWYAASPVGMPYGGTAAHKGSSEYAWFPLGGVWLCQEIWRTYEYCPDDELLRDTVLPLLEGSVRFCLDWLVMCNGYWVTNPSCSPEHRFEDPGHPGEYRAVSMASTLDMSLVREVFKNYRSATECAQSGLSGDPEYEAGRERTEELLRRIDDVEPKLYPFCIGSDGRLQEWYRDFREKEKGHRHFSHLYGLFPGELFCGSEELTRAAERSLEYRLENGSGYTGWSCAWAAEFFAVLGRGEDALRYLRRLLEHSTYDNLWDAHPPLFFQIDGNFGGASAIADMLVQDRGGEVKLLPALPEEWKDGYVRGLKVKGNRTVDIYWKDRKITKYRIDSAG